MAGHEETTGCLDGQMCFFTGQSAFLLFLPEAEGPKDLSTLVILMARDAMGTSSDVIVWPLWPRLTTVLYLQFICFVICCIAESQ